MIIETKDDVVRLSGSLNKNQWLTIKAAANLLLQEHPEGIIVDCANLEDISETGAKTFLEAIRDIEAAHARIVVANLPKNILSVCKMVPGVRSQLPIADSVEEARASLKMAARSAANAPTTNGSRKGTLILVPLLADLDLTYGAHLAGRLARDGKSEVRLLYMLEVTRTLPLNAPQLEAEQNAQLALGQAMQYVKQLNVPASEQIERVRDATEGILSAIKNYGASLIVLGASSPTPGESRDQFLELSQTLLDRAPCEVVIGRLKPNG